jgi:hypothetical protein
LRWVLEHIRKYPEPKNYDGDEVEANKEDGEKKEDGDWVFVKRECSADAFIPKRCSDPP